MFLIIGLVLGLLFNHTIILTLAGTIVGIIISVIVLVIDEKKELQKKIERSTLISNYIRPYLITGKINNNYYKINYYNTAPIFMQLYEIIDSYKKNLLKNVNDSEQFTEFDFPPDIIRKVFVGYISVGVGFRDGFKEEIHKHNNHIAITLGKTPGNILGKRWINFLHDCGFTEESYEFRDLKDSGFLCKYKVYAYIKL